MKPAHGCVGWSTPNAQRAVVAQVFKNLGLNINDVPGGANMHALLTRGMTDADYHKAMIDGKEDLQKTMLARVDSPDGVDKDETLLGDL